MIMHTILPEMPGFRHDSMPSSSRGNAEAIFARLDKEMDRQNKNIGVI